MTPPDQLKMREAQDILALKVREVRTQ
jgi:hypothetical protein